VRFEGTGKRRSQKVKEGKGARKWGHRLSCCQICGECARLQIPSGKALKSWDSQLPERLLGSRESGDLEILKLRMFGGSVGACDDFIDDR